MEFSKMYIDAKILKKMIVIFISVLISLQNESNKKFIIIDKRFIMA